MGNEVDIFCCGQTIELYAPGKMLSVPIFAKAEANVMGILFEFPRIVVRYGLPTSIPYINPASHFRLL
jgi:hypothetical protein